MTALPFSGVSNMGQAAEGNYLRFDEWAKMAERTLWGVNSIDVSAGGTIVLTLSGDIEADDWIKGYFIDLDTSPAAAFTLQVPDDGGRREIRNNTTKVATIQATTGGGTSIAIPAGEARKIAVESNNVRVDDAAVHGRQTVAVVAGMIFPTATSGCAALATREVSAGGINAAYLAFDSASEENAQGAFTLPKSWDGGDLYFLVKYQHDGTQTGGLDGVAWGFKCVCRALDETLSGAGFWGSEVTVTLDDANGNAELVTAVAGPVTPGGSPAGGETLYFNVARKVANAADDLDIDALLTEVVIFYTVNAGNDD